MKAVDYQRGIKRKGLIKSRRAKMIVVNRTFGKKLSGRDNPNRRLNHFVEVSKMVSQGQSIDFEIINPRDRATHGFKREKICRTAGRLAEVRIKSRTITKLYLVGSMDSWNNAKRAEESERVKHGVEFYE